MNKDQYQRIQKRLAKINLKDYIGEHPDTPNRYISFPISKHYVRDYSIRKLKHQFYKLLPFGHFSKGYRYGQYIENAHITSYEYSVSEQADKMFKALIKEDTHTLDGMKSLLEFNKL